MEIVQLKYKFNNLKKIKWKKQRNISKSIINF